MEDGARAPDSAWVREAVVRFEGPLTLYAARLPRGIHRIGEESARAELAEVSGKVPAWPGEAANYPPSTASRRRTPRQASSQQTSNATVQANCSSSSPRVSSGVHCPR